MKDTAEKQTPMRPSLHLNWEDWLPYVAHCDASLDDKRQAIEAVWSIAMGFVQLGWDIGDTTETGGQSFDLIGAFQAAVLHSDNQQKEEV